MTRAARGAALRALVVVAALLTGLAWAVSSPIGSAPDDDFHLASIWCPPPIEESGCPLYREYGRLAGVYAPELVADPACFAFEPELTARCQDDLSSTRLEPTKRVDQGDYPGPYYQFAHLFAGPDVGASVLAIRAFNTLLAVGLIGGAVLLVPTRIRPALAFALAASIVPMALSIVPSTNPSSWAFTGLTTFWICCLAMALTGDERVRVGAAALGLVGAVVAEVARNDSVLYVVLGLAVTVVLYARRPSTGGSDARALLRRWAPWITLVTISLGLGVWSLVTSRSSTGIVPDDERAGRNPWALLYYNLLDALHVPAGLLGRTGLGWNDVWPPATVYVTTLMIAGFVLLTGFRELSARKVLALLGVSGTLVFLPVVMLQRAMAFVGDQVQPRYFMSVLPLLLAVALLSADGQRALRFGRVQAVTVWAGLVLAQSITLYVYLRRYVVGIAGPLWLGDWVVWWWPVGFGPVGVWLLGTASFALALVPLIVTSGGTASRVPPVEERERPPSGKGSPASSDF